LPEGDTVLRAARTLHRALAGDVVTRFESMLPALTRVDADTPVRGRRIEAVSAAGKHLLVRFSGDLILHTHQGMNGSWHVYRPGELWQRRRSDMRIVVGTARFVAVAFALPVAAFHTERSLARAPRLRALGPDLLGAGFDAGEAARRLCARPAVAIADALLDQRVMAGAGNVFKSEILFACRVNPFARVGSLSADQVGALVRTARELLGRAVREATNGAIVPHAGARATTRWLDPAARLWVYGRAGAPCRVCGTAIARRAQGAAVRLTYWCPRCQATPPG
jgi:endonuclease VIII